MVTKMEETRVRAGRSQSFFLELTKNINKIYCFLKQMLPPNISLILQISPSDLILGGL